MNLYKGCYQLHIFYSINHQKLITINQLISINFCSQSEDQKSAEFSYWLLSCASESTSDDDAVHKLCSQSSQSAHIYKS